MNIFYKLKEKNRGYSAIVVVFLVTTIGITLATGITSTLIAREKMFRNMNDSVQSFYTAESGVEDLVLRLVDPSLDVNYSYNLVLGGASANTYLSHEGNQYLVTAEGSKNNLQRNIEVLLTDSNDGASFSYGIQIGAGGLDIDTTGAIIDGSVYSDGDIIGRRSGSNRPIITGDAWASGNHKIKDFAIISDAHAHTIETSEIGQAAYYQTLTNTIVYGTQHPGSADPPALAMPVSTTTMDKWKDDALAGGISTGNYTLSSGSASLGPKKIVGNLTLSGDAVLTLTGTVWVTGNISFGNSNSVIQLDPGYGDTSGVIISDGTITLQNNFNGCGSEGYNVSTDECNAVDKSFLMLATTSNVEDTISMKNNAKLNGILYAPVGEVKIENNAHLKEVTAYRLEIENLVTLTYETGLVDLSFSSGPGGGWDIGKWQEMY